jgi:hypothetical protein
MMRRGGEESGGPGQEIKETEFGGSEIWRT